MHPQTGLNCALAKAAIKSLSRLCLRLVLHRRDATVTGGHIRHRERVRDYLLAVKSTIFKVQLQVSDMDRKYFQTHALTLARHPSETEERMMVRLLAFALHADDALQFAGGLSRDEPDLWRKDLTGAIDLWVTVGQPDEQQIRRACGRARRVIVYTYSGRSAQVWWQKSAAMLQRSKNLSVIDLTAASSAALAALAEHGMQMQCFIQDGEVQMMAGEAIVPIGLTLRTAAP
jgi:uncharacterized protein YaeQ